MITFAEKNNTIYITADGHVTAQYCSDIKVKVFERLEQSPQIEHIDVDLANCTYMDSTFLGMLAGFNKHLKKISKNKLHLQHVNDNCKELLASMGLLQLLDTASPSVIFPTTSDNCTDKPISAKDMLTAHENLMEISEENKLKFETLHKVLSDTVKREEN